MFYNKKIIISCFFLFFVVVGLITPQITNASIWDAMGRGLIKGFAVISVGISRVFAWLTSIFLNWIISPDAIKVAYTPHKAGWGNNNQVVDAGWAICRDLANMLIVLGFVVIAIATILRFGEYEAKKLLPKLIIAAILVNFSPVICGLVIDASNITTNFFLKGSVNDILPPFAEQYNNIWNAGTSQEALAWSVGYTAGNVIAGLAFGLLFFLFLARYVMLWILVIFSPIAFVCCVFPFTKQYFKQWWDQFFKWCIMGIPAAFTLYLASSAYGLPISGPAGTIEGANFMDMLVTIMLPAFIILVGFYYSLKFSGAGAAIAVGAAMATGSFALGAITGGAKGKGVMGKIGAGLGNAIGGSRPVTAAKEALGLTPAGSTAQMMAQRRETAKKRLDNMTSDQLKNAALGRTHSSADRATATELLAGRGDLDKLGNKKDSAVQRAISHGVKRDIFEKADPNLAGTHEDIRKRVRGMTPKEIGKMGPSPLTPAVISSLDEKQLQGLRPAQKDYIKGTYINAPRGSEGRKKLGKYGRMFKNTGRKEDFTNMMNNIRNISGHGQQLPKKTSKTSGQKPPQKPPEYNI